MRLTSLAHLTVVDADPIQLIDAAKAGGFDAVGLRIVAPLPGDRIVPVVGDPAMQRRIKARLLDTGMSILDIEAVWLKPETDVEALKAALEVGADLGARHVLTVGFDDDRARLAHNFGRFCELAHGYGLRAMLEFIPYSTVPNLKAAHDLLIEVAPANAGLLVDALHLSRSGGRPADLAGYDPALFSYIHLCDAMAGVPPSDQIRAEAREARAYPGDGELWLDAFLDAFPPGTPVAVEAPNAAFRQLPAVDRARLCGEATRRFLDRHDRRA